MNVNGFNQQPQHSRKVQFGARVDGKKVIERAFSNNGIVSTLKDKINTNKYKLTWMIK